jgi:putative FmdB family regulatory protein
VPTYQYSCTDCGHFFEVFQSFSDDSLSVCPECDGKLRKVFNAVGVVFKGSGFYRTDSRGSSAGATGASSTSSSSDKSTSGDSAGSSSASAASAKPAASTSSTSTKDAKSA